MDIKAESKVGSMDNVKHKPGGGEKKIFDDREYLKQIDHPIPISPQPQVNIDWVLTSNKPTRFENTWAFIKLSEHFLKYAFAKKEEKKTFHEVS